MGAGYNKPYIFVSSMRAHINCVDPSAPKKESCVRLLRRLPLSKKKTVNKKQKQQKT